MPFLLDINNDICYKNKDGQELAKVEIRFLFPRIVNVSLDLCGITKLDDRKLSDYVNGYLSLGIRSVERI